MQAQLDNLVGSCLEINGEGVGWSQHKVPGFNPRTGKVSESWGPLTSGRVGVAVGWPLHSAHTALRNLPWT